MSGKKNGGDRKRTSPAPDLKDLEFPTAELQAIVDRARTGPITEAEAAKLKAIISTFELLKTELKSKSTSIERLKKLIFGPKTEKTHAVLGDAASAEDRAEAEQKAGESPKVKRPGHGHNGASAYTGATKVSVEHQSLHHGDDCPGCLKGKVYLMKEPGKLVRVKAVAPLQATVYECEKLRCNACNEVYTAAAPPGVGTEKYDASAGAMIEMLRYGTGLPFNRIEKLQEGLGVPLPASTQWDLVREDAETVAPLHEEFIRQAAQANLLHNDDTTMRILKLTPEQRAVALGEDSEDRSGVFTSGIVGVGEEHRIALFFTGARHAGENLTEVLKRRLAELPPPIQMCDGLSRNLTDDFETLLSECILHARRRYVDVAESFPEEVRFVLETLREVYKTDAAARKLRLNPAQRLQLHKKESGPRMAALEKWMQEQFAERKVEPNSGLGEAIQYMTGHWEGLTAFLRIEGAPLDNNVCERALKKAILHRRNSLYYKTLNGARVGDVFMALIYTAELNGIAPFDYLVALLRHPRQIAQHPAGWMPWNYQASLAALTTASEPPG
jgi:transposase